MALLELSDSSVDITVEDKTTLKGAVIASTANDLNLDTGSVEYSNIFDSKKSTSIGGGVSGSGIGSTNGVSSSANINYSLSNSTQVNIATIGEGNITVRDGGSTDKLNRDTTATQIITSDTGMKGGATVDSDTINLLTTNPVTTVDNAIDSAAGIAFKAITDGANVVNDTMVVAEKTGNLIEYKHFTTDDKVQYCLNMDDYEEKKANGRDITALDTLVYVKSKSAAGYDLTGSDVSDLRLASRYVIDDATNGIRENLEANIRVNSREDVNASLAVLDRFDAGDAVAARGYLAGVREADKQTSVIGTDTGIPSVASNDGLIYGGSTEKSGRVREMLEGWGQALNSWGTEKNQEITNSSVVKSAHEYGEYLNNNPDVALATCFGAAAIGTGTPIIISEAAASGLITPITQAVIGKNTSDQLINGTIAFTNTVIYWKTDNNPTIGGAAVTFGESYLLTGVNSYISGLNRLSTVEKVITTGTSNAMIDYGVQYAQVRTGQKDSIDINQVIFTGVGGSSGAALNRVLPETTGKVISDFPTIWTQISTSGVNTAIPVMLSK